MQPNAGCVLHNLIVETSFASDEWFARSLRLFGPVFLAVIFSYSTSKGNIIEDLRRIRQIAGQLA